MTHAARSDGRPTPPGHAGPNTAGDGLKIATSNSPPSGTGLPGVGGGRGMVGGERRDLERDGDRWEGGKGWGKGRGEGEVGKGAFHLVHTQFYMLSGPPPPFLHVIRNGNV